MPVDPGTAVRGVGLDLVPIARFQAAIDRWGDRFLNRIFTPGELEYCRSRGKPAIHLAGRFAAKEAVLKAIGTGVAGGITLRDVEVVISPGGAPKIALHNRALVISVSSGYVDFHLSLTHSGDYAAACVVAAGPANRGEP